MTRRMKTALIGGALLGLVCVAGAYIRSGFTASPVFVFSLWYNRVIIGLTVGAPWGETDRKAALLRGAIMGLLVSFAFYSSTGFQDPVSFMAGILYGVILEAWLSKPDKCSPEGRRAGQVGRSVEGNQTKLTRGEISMEINQQKKSLFNRFLDKIEAVGNKLPEVFMIFAMLCLFMMVLSMVLSLLNVSAVHPVTKDTLVVQNLISAAGITKLLTGIVTNFSGFAPLGVVLVCMLGVGLCEKSGLLKVALRHGLGSVKGSDLKIIVILVILSIMASAAGDSGFIVMPPLGALIFISIGRNPLAGMMVAYASVAAAYGGNIIPATIDVLLVGFTETAVKISGIPTPVNPLMNYYFQVSSVVLIVTIITFVTIKIVEPRLGKLENFVAEEIEEITPLQKKGLKWAGIAVLIFIALIVLGTAPANGMLRDPETHKIISTKAPLMAGLVVIITLMFYIPGMVYGRITKTIPNAKAMVEAMNKSMSEMGGYITLTFIMAQFTALFNWSNVGIILAIKGANALNSSGFPIPVVIVLLVLFIIPLDIFLGSASAKWAVLAPILVPMFMFLGYHPAFTQMVYRIGDAVINICSPLVAYYVMLLALGRKYDKNLGLGTMIATMLPYSIFLLVIWIIQLLVWYFLKLPLGPGGPMMLS